MASMSPQQGRENWRVTHINKCFDLEVTHITSSTHNSLTIASHMTLFNYMGIREFVGVHGCLESSVSAQLITMTQLYYNFNFFFFFAEGEIGENAVAVFPFMNGFS